MNLAGKSGQLEDMVPGCHQVCEHEHLFLKRESLTMKSTEISKEVMQAIRKLC